MFDHTLGLADERETKQAEELIAFDKRAAEIHSKLKSFLSALDTLRPEPCPDDLVERTLRRLRQLADAERSVREPVVVRVRSWHNLIQVGVIAASIFLAVGVLIPSFGFARHQYRKHVCQNQLAGIGDSMNAYCADYDGLLPAATNNINQSWCNVGDQGQECRSNTRSMYLLLKLGYVNRPKNFVCCGRRVRVTLLNNSDISRYNDFPSREHFSYSYRIFCHSPVKMSQLAGQPIMADRNPIFEKVSEAGFAVQLDNELCRRNSLNHRKRGQNVLFTDGHTVFLRTRHVGIPQDDIFTVQNVVEYRGNERPACEKDPFLAP